MTYVFKNKLGNEIRISDERMEESKNIKIPGIGTYVSDNDINTYVKDRYEKD